MHMRDLALFVAGLVAGTFLMPSSSAQTNTNPGLRLNHVGIAVTDFQKSLDFYTKVMGFRVAFKFPGPEGKPTTTFLQLNRDTFIEMAPASANLPAGITHIGIESADEKTTILQLRQAGATVQDARVSAQTNALLSNVTDPDGIRLELVELTPDSLHKKAEDAWK
jgi:catechol 2,3-dioxygenase-like lactoylglutathione lyase family enzyme